MKNKRKFSFQPLFWKKTKKGTFGRRNHLKLWPPYPVVGSATSVDFVVLEISEKFLWIFERNFTTKTDISV